MPSYSEERRQSVVAKLLPTARVRCLCVANQEGISVANLDKWRKEARDDGRCLLNAGDQGVEGWSSQDKFAALVESVAIDKQIAECCRRRGLFPEQLQRWCYDCEQAASLSHEDRRQAAAQTRARRRRINDLERELKRKDAALAETVGLLTLPKKARATWGITV